MAKVNGLQGVISGKLGNTVFRNRYGKTIAAQYQPNVMNRRTETQVAQREKFKLLNQLAAILAPAIGIPRNGSVTGRNIFVSLNQRIIQDIPNSNYVGINPLAIKLTTGNSAISQLRVQSSGGTQYENINITARGVFTGTLAVSTRPERKRTLTVVALAVPTGSNDPGKIVVGGFYELTDSTPNAEAGTYADELYAEPWEGIDWDAYVPVILAYEVTTTTENANRAYSNIGGVEITNNPMIVLSSLGSTNFANTTFSETIGVIEAQHV